MTISETQFSKLPEVEEVNDPAMEETTDDEAFCIPAEEAVCVADEVCQPCNSDAEVRTMQMDVDVDACNRSIKCEEFLETNDRVFSLCGLLLNKNWKMTLMLTFPLLVVGPTLFWHYNLATEELWVRIGSAILFALPTILALCVFLREPGYIPRIKENPHPELDGTATCEVDGNTYKWCTTCHVWRPPRAKHCSQLDACIHVFDHYCPWVGNAIGARNYFPFYMFLMTAALALIIAAVEAFSTNFKNKDSNMRISMFWVTVLVGIFFGMFISLQFIMTTKNLYYGKTTQEWILQRSGSDKKGVFANLSVFCPPRPSQITRN